MDITEFKEMLVATIEAHERSCVYEVSSKEKECVLSAYVNGSHFLIKCEQISCEQKSLLR